MFSDDLKPGKLFGRDDVFDIYEKGPFYKRLGMKGPFYNQPGYSDNLKGTKKKYRTPLFRGNSSADPDDISDPQFDDCTVPLVWWPWWPHNPADFFLASLAPFHAMLMTGVIDKNIRFTPVLDGLRQPSFFQWYFDPFTDHPIQSLEDMSDKTQTGQRCWERILICKPYSIWFLRPGRPPHDGLMYGSLGQQIVDFQIAQGRLVLSDKSADVFRIAFIERTRKRRILNIHDVLTECKSWRLPKDGKFKGVECEAINLDNSDMFLETLKRLRSVNVLVGMHGAGLINHNFMTPNSSFVEIFPCNFGGKWPSQYYQDPSQKEPITFAWKIQVRNKKRCHPSHLHKPSAKPDLSTEKWVPGSLARDQDVTLEVKQIYIILGRIASMGGDRNQYLDIVLRNPGYLSVTQ